MYRDGHLGAALLAYTPFVYAVQTDLALTILGLFVAGWFASFPDVDMRLPLVKHRGITHTIIFTVALAVTTTVLAGYALSRLPPGMAGIFPARLPQYIGGVVFMTLLSHLLSDAITPSGVPLLWPLSSTRFSLGIVRADNQIANRLLFLAGAATLVLSLSRAFDVPLPV